MTLSILRTPSNLQAAALGYEVEPFVFGGTTSTAASVIVQRGTDGYSQHTKRDSRRRGGERSEGVTSLLWLELDSLDLWNEY